MFRKGPVQIVTANEIKFAGEFVTDGISPPEQSEVPSPSWNDVEPVVPGYGILSPRYTTEKCGRLVGNEGKNDMAPGNHRFRNTPKLWCSRVTGFVIADSLACHCISQSDLNKH